jgi:hypothetical protein
VNAPAKSISAWQPLTPRGVAAFARVPLRRLWLVQFIFALLAAAVVVWFVRTAWFPTVREAIGQLPEQGEIRDGKLDWPGDSPQLLAEGHFLAFTVDVNHGGQARSPAHIQIEFGRESFYVLSLLGYREWAYPKDRIIAFNREELGPKWGAWAPPVLWITVGAVIVGLMAVWTLLATIYSVPVWLAGYFTNRDLNLAGSWKLAGAALMPGALLLVTTILFYGWGTLDLVQLTAAGGAHLIIGWIYLFGSALFAPKLSSTTADKDNPFAPPASEKAAVVEKKTGDGPPESGT